MPARALKVGVQLPEVEWEARWPDLRAHGRPRRGARLRLDLVRRPPALPAARRRPRPRAVGGLDDARGAGGGHLPDHPRPARRGDRLPRPGDAGQDGGDGGRDQRRPPGPGPGRGLERASSSPPSASRSTTGSAASRRRSRSSARCCARARSTSRASSSRLATASWCRARATGRPAAHDRLARVRGCSRSRRRTWTPGTRGSTPSGTDPAGIAPLRDLVDAAARAAGRDPVEIERTVALQVRLPGGRGRIQGDRAKDAIPPVEGSAAEIASTLRAFAAEGIAHVQLVVDPITLASLDALAPVLEDLDRG